MSIFLFETSKAGGHVLPNQPEIERNIHNNMKFAFFNGYHYCYFMDELSADREYQLCIHENKSKVFDIFDLYFFSNSKIVQTRIYH